MMNLLVRPLGTRAAHVTPPGRKRAPLSQAVRVLLKTADRPVLVGSIRHHDGFFTGEICSPGVHGGDAVIQFREQHVFTYETAEDLAKRGPAQPRTPDQEHIPAFPSEPIPEQRPERSTITIEAIRHPPPRRLLKRSAVGAAFVVGGAMGYMLPHKATSPAVAAQVQNGEPARLRLDYELKTR